MRFVFSLVYYGQPKGQNMYKLGDYYISESDAEHIMWLNKELKNKERPQAKYDFDAIRQKKQTTTDTPLSARTISYWSDIGILNKSSAKKGTQWHKFSLADLAFIHIVAKLRDFGMGLDKVKNAKKDLYNLITLTDESDNIALEANFSILEYVVFLEMNSGIGRDIYFLITSSGNLLYMTDPSSELNKEHNTLPDACIRLNVKGLLDKENIIKNFQSDFGSAKTKYKLDDNERQIIDVLRQDNLEQLQISKDTEHNKLTTMETVQSYDNLEDIPQIAHGEIQTMFNDNKPTRNIAKIKTKFN